MQDQSNNNYTSFVEEIVSMIQSHQVVAIKSVKTISNQLYWSIGELILEKQAEHGWGQSVIDKLSSDLMARFGNDTISYSKRNLQFMRQLVLEYSNVNQVGSHLQNAIVKQAASLSKEDVKDIVFQVPWGQNNQITKNKRITKHYARPTEQNYTYFVENQKNIYTQKKYVVPLRHEKSRITDSANTVSYRRMSLTAAERLSELKKSNVLIYRTIVKWNL